MKRFRQVVNIVATFSRSVLCLPDSNDLVVTAGATQGLSLLSSLFFTAGDLVFVEDPTYFIALRILQEDLGLNCVPGQLETDVVHQLTLCL